MRKLIIVATFALCASVVGITATGAAGNNGNTMGYGMGYGPHMMMSYNQNNMMNYNGNGMMGYGMGYGMMNGNNYSSMPCGGPYYNQQAQGNGAYYCPGYNNYNQAQNDRYTPNNR